MRVFRGLDNLPAFNNAVATMGSFDGVHCGHRELLRRVIARAEEIGGESIVITFDPHPRYVLGTGERMLLLSTVDEKLWLLEQAGIDNVIIIPFTKKFSQTSPQEFIEKDIARIGIDTLVVGYNHRLGRGSEGSYESLMPLSQELGFRLERVEQFLAEGDKVSSTVVRNLFEKNDVGRACELLGHSYIVAGKACNGRLIVESSYKLIPADGVYSVNIVGHGQQDIKVRDSQIIIDNALCGELIIEF